jgi:hypothetical protein
MLFIIIICKTNILLVWNVAKNCLFLIECIKLLPNIFWLTLVIYNKCIYYIQDITQVLKPKQNLKYHQGNEINILYDYVNYSK